MSKKINKIILHWTAGGYYPNTNEKQHYHYLIDKDGKVYEGDYSPEDNLDCTNGKYAAHCGGGNTGAIGIALCGMYGFKNMKNTGKSFITRKQCESMFHLCAILTKKYNIPLENVMTHAEFGLKNPKTTSRGKIDITALPPCYDMGVTKQCLGKDLRIGYGDFIRQNKIQWYIQNTKETDI